MMRVPLRLRLDFWLMNSDIAPRFFGRPYLHYPVTLLMLWLAEPAERIARVVLFPLWVLGRALLACADAYDRWRIRTMHRLEARRLGAPWP